MTPINTNENVWKPTSLKKINQLLLWKIFIRILLLVLMLMIVLALISQSSWVKQCEHSCNSVVTVSILLFCGYRLFRCVLFSLSAQPRVPLTAHVYCAALLCTVFSHKPKCSTSCPTPNCKYTSVHTPSLQSTGLNTFVLHQKFYPNVLKYFCYSN